MTGPELQEVREEARLTQEQVANEVGVVRQTIVSWEGKATVKPTIARRYLEAVRKLAERAA